MLQVFNFATVILTAYMMWRGLGVILNNESPIVVVLRCSNRIAAQPTQLMFRAIPMQ